MPNIASLFSKPKRDQPAARPVGAYHQQPLQGFGPPQWVPSKAGNAALQPGLGFPNQALHIPKADAQGIQAPGLNSPTSPLIKAHADTLGSPMMLASALSDPNSPRITTQPPSQNTPHHLPSAVLPQPPSAAMVVQAIPLQPPGEHANVAGAHSPTMEQLTALQQQISTLKTRLSNPNTSALAWAPSATAAPSTTPAAAATDTLSGNSTPTQQAKVLFSFPLSGASPTHASPEAPGNAPATGQGLAAQGPALGSATDEAATRAHPSKPSTSSDRPSATDLAPTISHPFSSALYSNSSSSPQTGTNTAPSPATSTRNEIQPAEEDDNVLTQVPHSPPHFGHSAKSTSSMGGGLPSPTSSPRPVPHRPLVPGSAAVSPVSPLSRLAHATDSATHRKAVSFDAPPSTTESKESAGAGDGESESTQQEVPATSSTGDGITRDPHKAAEPPEPTPPRSHRSFGNLMKAMFTTSKRSSEEEDTANHGGSDTGKQGSVSLGGGFSDPGAPPKGSSSNALSRMFVDTSASLRRMLDQVGKTGSHAQSQPGIAHENRRASFGGIKNLTKSFTGAFSHRRGSIDSVKRSDSPAVQNMVPVAPAPEPYMDSGAVIMPFPPARLSHSGLHTSASLGAALAAGPVEQHVQDLFHDLTARAPGATTQEVMSRPIDVLEFETLELPATASDMQQLPAFPSGTGPRSTQSTTHPRASQRRRSVHFDHDEVTSSLTPGGPQHVTSGVKPSAGVPGPSLATGGVATGLEREGIVRAVASASAPEAGGAGPQDPILQATVQLLLSKLSVLPQALQMQILQDLSHRNGRLVSAPATPASTPTKGNHRTVAHTPVHRLLQVLAGSLPHRRVSPAPQQEEPPVKSHPVAVDDLEDTEGTAPALVAATALPRQQPQEQPTAAHGVAATAVTGSVGPADTQRNSNTASDVSSGPQWPAALPGTAPATAHATQVTIAPPVSIAAPATPAHARTPAPTPAATPAATHPPPPPPSTPHATQLPAPTGPWQPTSPAPPATALHTSHGPALAVPHEAVLAALRLEAEYGPSAHRTTPHHTPSPQHAQHAGRSSARSTDHQVPITPPRPYNPYTDPQEALWPSSPAVMMPYGAWPHMLPAMQLPWVPGYGPVLYPTPAGSPAHATWAPQSQPQPSPSPQSAAQTPHRSPAPTPRSVSPLPGHGHTAPDPGDSGWTAESGPVARSLFQDLPSASFAAPPWAPPMPWGWPMMPSSPMAWGAPYAGQQMPSSGPSSVRGRSVEQKIQVHSHNTRLSLENGDLLNTMTPPS